MRDVAGAGGPSASRGENIAPDEVEDGTRPGLYRGEKGGVLRNASGPHYTQQSHCLARGRKRDYLRCTPHSTTRLPEGTFRGSVDAWPCLGFVRGALAFGSVRTRDFRGSLHPACAFRTD
jgi:hypothetical protein